jgi:hypothetical protein
MDVLLPLMGLSIVIGLVAISRSIKSLEKTLQESLNSRLYPMINVQNDTKNQDSVFVPLNQ